MTAKEYLTKVKRYEEEIDAYLNEIQRLNDMATSITAAAKTDVVQSSGSQQKMADAVTNIVELQEKIKQTVNAYIRHKELVKKQINGISNHTYRLLLWKRYVENKTFEKIAVDMDYSWRHVIRMHGSALELFTDKYKDFL